MRSDIVALATHLDPRGRANRRELLIIAILLLGAEAWLMLLNGLTGEEWPLVTMATKAVVLVIGGIAMIRRLHDMNLSGWWLPAGFAGSLLWTFAACGAALLLGGFQALEPGTTSFAILLAVSMLPPLAATLFLHFAQGDATANRFGKPPNVPDVDLEAAAPAAAQPQPHGPVSA